MLSPLLITTWRKLKRSRPGRRDGDVYSSLLCLLLRGESFCAIVARVRETMRAKRVKQEIGVSPFLSPTSLPRGHEGGEARDPISVRTSLPQTLQQQQDLTRIVPVAGARLAVPLPPCSYSFAGTLLSYPWSMDHSPFNSARPLETRIYRGRRRFDSIRWCIDDAGLELICRSRPVWCIPSSFSRSPWGNAETERKWW